VKKRAPLRLVDWRPIEALVLGVDPGSASGAALVVGGAHLHSARDLVRAWDGLGSREQRLDVCAFAADEADERGLRLVAVVETWNPHGKWGFDAIVGLAEQAGRWLDTIEEIGAPIVRVESQAWRRALFGGGPNRKTAAWKELARAFAEQRSGRKLEANAAEAFCIATWGTRAQPVAEALLATERAETRAAGKR
jgi:hypothetical protein